MPTTANFSLEYPDDNSSVDIAGHFETLADDVDEAINTRLALSGGTLTGALVGTLTTDSSSSTTGAFKTAGGMGIAKALYVGTTLNVTGATTLTGDLTISKAAPTLTVTGSAAVINMTATSGEGQINASRTAGNIGGLFLRTSGSKRWFIYANSTAESGSNAGSDLSIARYSDAGAYTSDVLSITRSTGAITLTGTLNGKVVNDLITGPASATDNALVRFDGTTGKVVQNSGITVDDSGYVTSDLSCKSTLSLRDSSTGNMRWRFTAIGSVLYLSRYNDAGAGMADPVTVSRSNGQVTLTESGAAGGLVLGSSGPRVMSGTGSPEGVVTAPVGSRWIRADGDTLGDFEYQKRSGTGSTGWVVADGDTGSRDISSVLTADANRTLASTILLRRTGNRVVLSGVWRETTTTPNNRAFYSLPVGFRPAQTLYQYVPYDAANTTVFRNIRVPNSGNITYGGPTSGSNFEYHVQWTTVEAWPTSLPGSAA